MLKHDMTWWVLRVCMARWKILNLRFDLMGTWEILESLTGQQQQTQQEHWHAKWKKTHTHISSKRWTICKSPLPTTPFSHATKFHSSRHVYFSFSHTISSTIPLLSARLLSPSLSLLQNRSWNLFIFIVEHIPRYQWKSICHGKNVCA